MRLIHPSSTRVTVEGVAATGEVSTRGVVKHREHWDGRIDAKVLPGTIRHRVKPKPSEWLRLMELEAAAADRRTARLSGDASAIRRAEDRVSRARAAFVNVKFGERVVEAIHVEP